MVPIGNPWVVYYSTSIESNVVSLTIFEIFDIVKGLMHHVKRNTVCHCHCVRGRQVCIQVRINSTSGLADRYISDFYQKQHLLGLYLGGKFGEDRWKIAICRAFNSFCVTD